MKRIFNNNKVRISNIICIPIKNALYRFNKSDIITKKQEYNIQKNNQYYDINFLYNYIPFISKYIGGFTLEQLHNNILNIKKEYPNLIFDYAIENKNNKNIIKDLEMMFDSFTEPSIFALKLSSMNIDTRSGKYNTEKLVKYALNRNHKLLIDAENKKWHLLINEITDNLMKKYNRYNINIYKTYQMYRKDSYENLKNDLLNKDIYHGIKLVRGAYFHEEKHMGHLFTNINDTHENYNNAIKLLQSNYINNKKYDIIYATHNKESINLIKNYKNAFCDLNSNNISFAHLLGISNDNTKQLIKEGYKIYKYVPYGPLLDTIPYLIRRLYENYDIIKHK